MNIPDEIYKQFNMEKPKEKEISKQNYQEFDIFSKLKEASMENPVFVKITGRDLIGILVACEGVKDMIFEVSKYESYTAPEAHFRILEGEHKAEGRCMEFDHIISLKYLDATKELQKLYKDTMDTIKCEIHVKAYPDIEIPDNISHLDLYSKKIEPLYEETYKPEGVRTLEEADKWILKNHPEEYISMCASNNIGDFTWGAIPQAYDEGGLLWADRRGREEIIRKFAEIEGYEVGEFNYDKIDEFIRNDYEKITKNLEEQGLKLKEPEGLFEEVER